MIRKDKLMPGDHIYRHGTGWIYTHHGIYMGEKEAKESGSSSSKHYKTVIHYTRTEAGGKELSSCSSKPCRLCNYKSNLQRGVVETCLDCFLLAGHRHMYLYEYGVSWSKKLFSRSGTCSTVLSGPPSDVEDLASRLLIADLFGRYNLLRNNCENFAHFCSTGSSRSPQIESLITSSLIFMVLLMLASMKEFFTVLIMWANALGYISTEYATAKIIDASVWLISLFLFIYFFMLLGDIQKSHEQSCFILEKLKQEPGDYQPPQWLINACKMPGQEEVDRLEQWDYQLLQWSINACKLPEQKKDAGKSKQKKDSGKSKQKKDAGKSDKKKEDDKLDGKPVPTKRVLLKDPGKVVLPYYYFTPELSREPLYVLGQSEMVDYIGFWRKELKALVSEHLKASVLENIDNPVRQTGEEDILRDHIKMDRDTLEAGHHIYCFGQGKIHTHHGIYVGETEVKESGSSSSEPYQTVIHYIRTVGGKKTCAACGYRSDLHHGVVKTCLDCFLAGQDQIYQDQIYWYVYGVSESVASSFPVGSCSTKQSRPPSEAVECASQLLESGFKDYNLFFNNCEDFAHFCKTGVPTSSRTDYVRNSLWSFTQNIIKLATEMDYFGLGGSASVKTFVLVLLLLLLICVSPLFLLEYLCSSGLRHLGLIFRWLKQLCFRFCRGFQRFKIE